MSPDGTKVLVPNNDDQTVSVIDVKTNKVITTFPGGEGMTGINFVNGGEKGVYHQSTRKRLSMY